MPIRMGGTPRPELPLGGGPQKYGNGRYSNRSPYHGMRNPPIVDAVRGHRVPLVDDGQVQGLFEIREERDDYLLCVGYNPHGGQGFGLNEVIAIAKPYLLLKTPWDGRTVEVEGIRVSYEYTDVGVRKASGRVDGELVEETQKITESYTPGDIITAVRMVRGQHDNYGYAAEDNQPLEFVDQNMSGRAWAVDTNA